MDYIVTNDTIAQSAHAGCGAALVFILTLLFMPWWGAALVVLVFAAVKEAIESRWAIWEPIQPWESGRRDFIFWSIGVCVACVVLVIH